RKTVWKAVYQSLKPGETRNGSGNCLIFLLFAGLMVKVPVGLYFSCKLLLFQSLMLMSPEDSAFYATIVSVVGLHVVLATFVFIVWEEGLPQWRENKND
uniref:Uncharacterized protein n=1 Tax=Rattus norvegicus TaxID=10116 RepID=A0ABK0M0Q3_RAT